MPVTDPLTTLRATVEAVLTSGTLNIAGTHIYVYGRDRTGGAIPSVEFARLEAHEEQSGIGYYISGSEVGGDMVCTMQIDCYDRTEQLAEQLGNKVNRCLFHSGNDQSLKDAGVQGRTLTFSDTVPEEESSRAYRRILEVEFQVEFKQ